MPVSALKCRLLSFWSFLFCANFGAQVPALGPRKGSPSCGLNDTKTCFCLLAFLSRRSSFLETQRQQSAVRILEGNCQGAVWHSNLLSKQKRDLFAILLGKHHIGCWLAVLSQFFLQRCGCVFMLSTVPQLHHPRKLAYLHIAWEPV